MNLRTVTRGDAALAASALLLFVSSFLTFYEAGGVQCTAVGGVPSGCTSTNAWSVDLFPLLPSVFFLGIIGAALVLVARNLPQAPAVLGIPLRAWGTVLTVASAWSALWALFGSPSGALFGHPDATSSPQVGAFLAFVFAALTAALAIAGPVVPLLTAPLLPEPAPAGAAGAAGATGVAGFGAPQPQHGHPHVGHFGGQPVQQAHPGQPFTGPEPVGADPFPTPSAAGPAATPTPSPALRPESKPEPQDEPPTVPATFPLGSRTPPPAAAAAEPEAPAFAPFWFAVPAARPLAPEGQPQGTPVGELVPGTWYLAIAQRGEALLTQTQEGKRGLLADTSGIQRG